MDNYVLEKFLHRKLVGVNLGSEKINSGTDEIAKISEIAEIAKKVENCRSKEVIEQIIQKIPGALTYLKKFQEKLSDLESFQTKRETHDRGINKNRNVYNPLVDFYFSGDGEKSFENEQSESLYLWNNERRSGNKNTMLESIREILDSAEQNVDNKSEKKVSFNLRGIIDKILGTDNLINLDSLGCFNPSLYPRFLERIDENRLQITNDIKILLSNIDKKLDETEKMVKIAEGRRALLNDDNLKKIFNKKFLENLEQVIENRNVLMKIKDNIIINEDENSKLEEDVKLFNIIYGDYESVNEDLLLDINSNDELCESYSDLIEKLSILEHTYRKIKEPFDELDKSYELLKSFISGEYEKFINDIKNGKEGEKSVRKSSEEKNNTKETRSNGVLENDNKTLGWVLAPKRTLMIENALNGMNGVTNVNTCELQGTLYKGIRFKLDKEEYIVFVSNKYGDASFFLKYDTFQENYKNNFEGAIQGSEKKKMIWMFECTKGFSCPSEADDLSKKLEFVLKYYSVIPELNEALVKRIEEKVQKFLEKKLNSIKIINSKQFEDLGEILFDSTCEFRNISEERKRKIVSNLLDATKKFNAYPTSDVREEVKLQLELFMEENRKEFLKIMNSVAGENLTAKYIKWEEEL